MSSFPPFLRCPPTWHPAVVKVDQMLRVGYNRPLVRKANTNPVSISRVLCSIFFEKEAFFCDPEELGSKEAGGVAVLRGKKVTTVILMVWFYIFRHIYSSNYYISCSFQGCKVRCLCKEGETGWWDPGGIWKMFTGNRWKAQKLSSDRRSWTWSGWTDHVI